MKKYLFAASAGVLAAIALAAGKNSDAVLMKVNGTPVMVSEFEYLYGKNNSQQLKPQTIDDYLPMFVNYKLKLADAKAMGLDTTATFKTEFDRYRRELASPYFTDTAFLEQEVREAYRHYANEVNVSHLMYPAGMDKEETAKNKLFMDSLRNALANGTDADWAAAVAKYTIDHGSKDNAGKMGWLPVGAYPKPFEDMAYATPKGQLSQVVNSGYGLHIIKVNDARPSRGQVRASHILTLTRGKTPEQAARAKVLIDSLYEVVTAPGADFAEIAKKFSEDPGSAARGGDLDWFGPGMMVSEFDSVAFALPENAISKPFATAFGYHIVKNTGHRAVDSFQDKYADLMQQCKNGEAGMTAYHKFMETAAKKYNGERIKDGIAQVSKLIRDNKSVSDTVLRQMLAQCPIAIARVNGKDYPMSDALRFVPTGNLKDPSSLADIIDNVAAREISDVVTGLLMDQLMIDNADYRNLVNEYHDGNLVFDASNAKVWEAAAKDKAGLENYFRQHKDKYVWEKPKYKGFIVFASSDSVLNEARQYAQSLKFDPDTFAAQMREKFGKDVKVERILAGKGDNPISDYLFFDGPAPDTSKITWKHFFGFGGHLAQQPEEVLDVRSLVTTDYQNELEKQWLDSLRAKYPVKVDKKALNNLRKRHR